MIKPPKANIMTNIKEEIVVLEKDIQELWTKLRPMQDELSCKTKRLKDLKIQVAEIRVENILKGFEERKDKEEVLYTEDELKLILNDYEDFPAKQRAGRKLLSNRYSNKELGIDYISSNSYHTETNQAAFKLTFIKDDKEVGLMIKKFIEFILPHMSKQRDWLGNSMFRTFLEEHKQTYKLFKISSYLMLICLENGTYHLMSAYNIRTFKDLDEAIEYMSNACYQYNVNKNGQLYNIDSTWIDDRDLRH